jgi:hypothetical protein
MKTTCHLCGDPVRSADAVTFGVSRRAVQAQAAHIDCVAIEALTLIWRRDLGRRPSLSLVPNRELV